MPDPVVVLATSPDVEAAFAMARGTVDELLWNRAARSAGRALGAESMLLGAWADAAFEGAEVPLAGLRSGAVEESPIGRTMAATVAVYREIPAAAEIIGRTPWQALARLHASVAAGFVPDEEVGRPRSGDTVADPLNLRLAAPAAEVPARLTGVAGLLSRGPDVPALAVAALVHGELAVVQPFTWGSGLLARAMTRLVLRSRGVDPDGWTVPEAGLRQLGRAKYVAALRSYATGDPESVRRWLVVHAECVAFGARAAADLLTDLPS